MKSYLFIVIIYSFIPNIWNAPTSATSLKDKAGKLVNTGADYALDSDVVPLTVKAAAGAGKS